MSNVLWLGVLNGEPFPESVVAYWADRASVVLVADGGISILPEGLHARAVLIGDLDSASEVPAGVKLIEDPDPDSSDLDKLLRYAASEGAQQVTLICAHGGRMDHFLAQFSSASASALSVRWIQPDQHARLVRAGETVRWHGEARAKVSVFAWGGACTCVSEGLKWPLGGCQLEPGTFWSLSNEMEGSEASLRVESGTAVLFVEASALEMPWSDSLP